MNCGQAREVLGAFADNELTGDVREHVTQHLAGCTRCAALAEEQRLVKAFVRRRVPVTPTPPAARTRVLRALEAEATRQSAPALWRRWYEHLAAWGAQQRYGRYGLGLAAAAIVLLLAIAPLFRGSQPALLQEVAEHYAAVAKGEPSLSIRTASITTLQDFYQRSRRFDFTNTVPDLTAAGFQLVGGKVSQVGPHTATLSVFEGGSERVMCQRFRASNFELPGGGVTVDGQRMYTVDGVTVRVVIEGDVVCMLASAMSPETFASALAQE